MYMCICVYVYAPGSRFGFANPPPSAGHARVQSCRIPVTGAYSPTWRLQDRQLSRGSRPKRTRILMIVDTVQPRLRHEGITKA